MNLDLILHLTAFAWWSIAMAIFLASIAAGLLFPRTLREPAGRSDSPPLTAIVPIKDFEPGFDDAQDSLFLQEYPGLTILIATTEARSPALESAALVMERHSGVASRIVRSTVTQTANPKINNLWAAFHEAMTDLILIKDANLVLGRDDLAAMVRHLSAGVGLVCTIFTADAPRSFAAQVETCILNGYHARMLILARALGIGVGQGKAALFRRSDLVRVGGLGALGWAIGEDLEHSRALARIGLRTVFVDRLARQDLGSRAWGSVWQRQLRWMLIHRLQAPLVFIGEPFVNALPTAIAGAIAASIFHVAPLIAALATLCLWLGLEALLAVAKGWHYSAWTPIASLVREFVNVTLWLRALTTRYVTWGGVLHEMTGSRPAIDAANTPQPGPV